MDWRLPSKHHFTDVASQAYESILAHAGAYGGNGIIESQNKVGGWPQLRSETPPQDSDRDGMPDEWERANNLNPFNAADRNTQDSIGYTMLERYINGLVD